MGTVTISIDAELGWGFHDYRRPPSKRVEHGRSGWMTTLDLLDRFDIPATWAIVGHLMLDGCDGVHDGHPLSPEWFAHERGQWRDRPDLRFGRELIHRVIDTPQRHEIASHSFSHVQFGRPNTTTAVARYEIERCLEIVDQWDLTVDSFVFPRNDVGHRDILAEYGFTTYRGTTPYAEGITGHLRRCVRPGPLLVTPEIDEYGLVNVPASLFLFGFEGRLRSIAESIWADPIVRLAMEGVDRAAENDGVFHLWFHPNNIVTDRDVSRLEALLEHIADRRSTSQLRVEPMGVIGNEARSDQREPTTGSSSPRPTTSGT